MENYFFDHILYSLFERIKRISLENDHIAKYASGWLVGGIILFDGCSRLPYFWGYIPIFSFLFYIPPFEALNYSLQVSEEYETSMSDGFNNRHIVLIILGVMLWLLNIVGTIKFISECATW
jgi:hypothetical protein